ncbi:MAG: hypothetical protein BWX48_02762 [Verrucomicrobia bacterium ADurb.Bin006]|jgi:hypothetical protein|nr:MAG: hypothetical protein BWX48_02762 [Verrucomicrobia bacterium ADurb.Bin006]
MLFSTNSATASSGLLWESAMLVAEFLVVMWWLR